MQQKTQWEEVKEAVKAAGFKDYNEYLFSEHWKELKSRCKLDKCCVCRTQEKVLGHHIRYKAILDVVPEDIAPMCFECHDDFHMACRKWGLRYIDMEIDAIARVTIDFKASEWCRKWKQRKAKKALGREKIPKADKVLPKNNYKFWVVTDKKARVTAIPFPRKTAMKIIKAIGGQCGCGLHAEMADELTSELAPF